MINDELRLQIQNYIIPGFFVTLKMVFIASFFAVIIGTVLGIVLYITEDKGLRPNKTISWLVGIIVNIGRSLPFIILIIATLPITKMIVGKSFGDSAATASLTIAAIPFVARIMEASFNEIDKGVIEAAKAMGATDFQIIFKVLLPESICNIISNITITIISIVGYSAMAGTIGGGGLGNVAITKGYQSFNTSILVIAVVLLILIVQFVQILGNYLSKNIVFILHSFKK